MGTSWRAFRCIGGTLFVGSGTALAAQCSFARLVALAPNMFVMHSPFRQDTIPVAPLPRCIMGIAHSRSRWIYGSWNTFSNTFAGYPNMDNMCTSIINMGIYLPNRYKRIHRNNQNIAHISHCQKHFRHGPNTSHPSIRIRSSIIINLQNAMNDLLWTSV